MAIGFDLYIGNYNPFPFGMEYLFFVFRNKKMLCLHVRNCDIYKMFGDSCKEPVVPV